MSSCDKIVDYTWIRHSSLFVVLTNICFRSIAHNLIKPIASPILMLDLLTNHSLRFFTWYETVYYRLMKRIIKSPLLTVFTQKCAQNIQCLQRNIYETPFYVLTNIKLMECYWERTFAKNCFRSGLLQKLTSFCWSKRQISLCNLIILLIGMKE